MPRIDRLNSVEMRPVLSEVYDELQGKSAENIRIPVFDADQPFSLFAAAQFGMLNEDYHRVYVKTLRATDVDFRACSSFPSYFACASEVLRGQYPLLMTSRYLTPSILTMGVGGRVILVLAGREPVQDLCAFWALRMTPGLGRADVIFLPIDVFRSAKNLEHLAEWCNRSLVSTNFLTVACASVNRRRLRSFRTRLHKLLRDEVEFVDLRVSHFTMGKFRIRHEETQEELTWLGYRTRLRRPLPSFDNHYLGNAATWVLDLELENPACRQHGFIPPDFPRLNYILDGRPRDQWMRIGGYHLRKAHGVLSRRVSKFSEFFELKLPREEDVFRELMDCAGYKSAVTDKCRFVTGMTKLMASVDTTHLLREGILRKSLRELARLGRTYDLHGIQQLARCPKERRSQLQAWIAALAQSGALLRGYRLRCPECALETWYPLEQVAETIHCAGCLTRFQAPLTAPFCFKLDRLLELGIEQGSIPVILTVALLRDLSIGSFLHIPGIQVTGEGVDVDIDILATCDGHLVAVECKDFEGGCSTETAVEAAEQLRKTCELARHLGAEIVFLSMMSTDKHPVLVEAVAELDRITGPSVHILDLDDLERGHLIEPLEAPAEAGQEAKHKRIWLSDLLPQEPPAEGWIKEPGERRWSFP